MLRPYSANAGRALRMLAVLQFLVTLTGAVCMIVAAVRHEEWRGGLAILSAVALAAAANECELFWLVFCDPDYDEPELLPILSILAGGVAAAVINRGTVLPGLRAVFRNRRAPILAWGLLGVSLLPNIAKAKWLWQVAIPGIEGTHNLRECAAEVVQFLGDLFLLNWAVLFLKDKYRRFARRTGPLNALLYEHPMVEIGRGTRRVAYKLGDTGLCVKFYRLPEEAAKMKSSVRRDVKWRRFNKHRNSCSAEVHIYNVIRHTMPAEIKRMLPEVCERVYHPRWGWGVIETYYTNPDGTAVIPYDKELRRQHDPAVIREIYRQASHVLDLLIANAALFHEPGNIHVMFKGDGSLEMRIVDFEPESKTLIPLELVWPWYRRRKLRRKAARFLASIRRRYNIPERDDAALPPEGA